MNTTASPKTGSGFLPIFLTVFIDMLGVGIIIPVLAPLFLDVPNAIVPRDYSLATRTALLGFLSASYPIAQFFGAPLLGAWSDRIGRKKTLIISLIGTCIGYILFGVAILTKNLPLLFASRILDGFTGGNISIALSAIADISNPKEKARNFGMVGMAFGLGFILGPYIGGKLADSSIVGWFDFATPFWFAALLSFINIILVIFRFRDTLMTRIHRPLSMLTGMRNISKALAMTNMRTIFMVIFLFTFGFTFFTQFFQVYLVDKLHYTQSNIGDVFAYIGLWIAFTQGFLNRFIGKRAQSTSILKFSLLGLSMALAVLLIPATTFGLLFVLPFVAISNGLSHPNLTAVVSNMSADDSQGEILGIQQSIQSLAMAIPPIIAGFIFSIDRNLPIMVASLSVLVAWIVMVLAFRQVKQEIFR